MSDALVERLTGVLAEHEGRVQNLDGDWLCTCGAFLCPPGDDRLGRSHRQHLVTVLSREAVEQEIAAARAEALRDVASERTPTATGSSRGQASERD